METARQHEIKPVEQLVFSDDFMFGAGLPAYTFERRCAEDAGVSLGDKTHHVVFNAAAYDRESDPEVRDFLSFVKSNRAESDFTRGIADMVNAKKFEQSFVNEYMAWNLHDQDVERRGKEIGKEIGRISAYVGLIKDGLLSLKDAASRLGISETALKEKCDL